MTLDLLTQDKQHRQLALDPQRSFIVQAPAGSGKTELLIQRFLTLLYYVDKPEEILAITFTKKAANEMRARVINALKSALLEPQPESEHAKQTWRIAKKVLEKDSLLQWNLLINPNQLRIQTIDSFCVYLTKQLPLLSHFGSQPEFSNHSQLLYTDAVRHILTHIENDYPWSEAISTLLLHLDNDLNKLLELLVTLLEKRDQWLPHVYLGAHEQIKAILEDQLSLVITEALDKCYQLLPLDLENELITLARYAADQLIYANIDSPTTACRDLEKITTESKALSVWKGLAHLLLTKDQWRKAVDTRIGFPAASNIKNPDEKKVFADFKSRIHTLLTSLHDYPEFKNALYEINFLPPPSYNKNQWKVLTALFTVLKVVAAQLRVSFQEHGQIDFTENTQAALMALGNQDDPTDLALALDYQIKHILMDEFQDTSITQYQLLEKLITGWESHDGRTLFIVGDPMQSIYRFREAEVGIFIRMWNEGIGHIKLETLSLSVNFRSSDEIVRWNNTHFNKIFPKINNIADGAVSYKASISHAQQSQHNSNINIRGFINSSYDEQAYYVASVVKNIQLQHPQESIAILVRSRSSLVDIISVLKKEKISYNAVEIDSLAKQQVIQDLFALTRALLHPDDRIAWLALLRAPWCGLSLHDLTIISSKAYGSLFTEINDTQIFHQLSKHGQTALNKILPTLNHAIANRQRTNLRAWIENTWLLIAGPACLQNMSELDYANAFFKLLEQFPGNHFMSIEQIKTAIDHLYAENKHTDCCLQIMTIHNAKGLEFDTVIIPHLESTTANEDKRLLAWMERPLQENKTALLLAPIHAIGEAEDELYTYINRQQKLKLNYELERLLYVATTRAKSRLYLTFDVKENAEKEVIIEQGCFLKKLWAYFENDVMETTAGEELPSKEFPVDPPERQIRRLTFDWINPIKSLELQEVVSHQSQSGFQLMNSHAKVIGNITHKIFQLITQLGLPWWQNKNAQEQSDYIQRQLKQATLPHEIIPLVQNKVITNINNILSDPNGLWLLHPHSDAQSEFPLSVLIDDKIVNVIIDRTFIDDKGIRWIIDYKTAVPTQESLPDFLNQQQKSYASQLTSYRTAFNNIEDRPIRSALYFPSIPHLFEC